MVGSTGRWRQYGRWTLMACGALACFFALGGCAANGGASATESSADLVTPSDEPEARRRARIRLELAANYFEMGQTAVALDEVKQSLASDATYADAHNLRGLIYLRLNDFAQAEESFRRALALRPGDSNVLHNFGWLLCQQKKYAEADQQFVRALNNPAYLARSKTLMAKGLCQVSAAQYAEAEQSLIKAYELDAANPVVGYHLASLLLRRNEWSRAQFYIRRLNNSEYANSESLWLGIKVERALGDTVALRQLADQLRKRFPDSREWGAFERGAFNE
ncbi:MULTISPECIES: type IV pilus biogenesis/stability protein PilW [unclassified Acidovorax]|jgi:type IV pilus assembly protein PilF|uniref:type IV pilus biogenesis/stability protein PilW n=1 Tax=unclassified Acidovorax TaxID=2684926 RepID=UPI000B3FE9B0|nr:MULTISPECIES: type IV pilus biogenesis/stability protein PilW [unclassified Acidovorax]MBP3980270.1 type IV pilus biogenesis/stability protein PilW [Acidovorax sp. JG5]MBU4422640.1 type IV pilus biogenesis/stability protein PilW [Gammaproteobacteria bacterium]